MDAATCRVVLNSAMEHLCALFVFMVMTNERETTRTYRSPPGNDQRNFGQLRQRPHPCSGILAPGELVAHPGGGQTCLSTSANVAKENFGRLGHVDLRNVVDAIENFARSEIRNHLDNKSNSLKTTDKTESKK